MTATTEAERALSRERNRRYRERHADKVAEAGRIYREQRREAINAASRARYAADPEPFHKRSRKWRAANREQDQAARRAWDIANKERVAEASRRWAQENPDRIRLARDRYLQAHPERVRALAVANVGLRRARMRNAPAVERIDRDEIIARDSSRCHICGKLCAPSEIHLDHIVPLAEGGEHTARNLAVAHGRCNQRKGTRAANDQLRLIG